MKTTQGSTQVREHCTFRWAEGGRRRAVRIDPSHCGPCIAELRRVVGLQGIQLVEVSNPDEPTIDALGRLAR